MCIKIHIFYTLQVWNKMENVLTLPFTHFVSSSRVAKLILSPLLYRMESMECFPNLRLLPSWLRSHISVILSDSFKICSSLRIPATRRKVIYILYPSKQVLQIRNSSPQLFSMKILTSWKSTRCNGKKDQAIIVIDLFRNNFTCRN